MTLPSKFVFFLNPENSLFNLEYTDSRATKWMQEVKWWKFHEQIPDLVLNSIALRQLMEFKPKILIKACFHPST